ncbi:MULTISPECIES: Scr1 family TA system antitoxin-like transcriptional regulator [Streptomyces]|uniref:Transcriptional regulator WhiJ n=1 Tax=Streptomyces luteosporeus TaxID=173856 RepID=A0ABN3TJV0_9ACTN
MPPRKEPSARQRRLGAELRKLRERAGISGDRAAALLDTDRARISNIESGRLDVTRNRLYMLLREYGCPPGPLFDGLMAMAQESGKGWWDDFKDSLQRRAFDLAELESQATTIRSHESSVVPGLLQTEDYAHAVISSVEKDHRHLDRWVQFRLARQRVLPRLQKYHAVIPESGLRMMVGDAKIMRRQLLRLIEVARLPHVTVQIFPFEKGPYSTFVRSFVLFGGATPELDTLYREHPTSADFIGAENVVADYAAMFDRIAAMALPPVDPDAAPERQAPQSSLSLIQHILYELR